jgi:hypothetical protein
MFRRSCVALLVLFVVGCVRVHVYEPFKDINTMLVEAGPQKPMLSSAKAILVVYRRTPETEKQGSEAKVPKLVIVDFDDLRDVRFVDQEVSLGSSTTGDVRGRESILVYKPGYEPVWLERRRIGKEFRYPSSLMLKPCPPVRARQLAADAIRQAFRMESESTRQAALKKLAANLN